MHKRSTRLLLGLFGLLVAFNAGQILRVHVDGAALLASEVRVARPRHSAAVPTQVQKPARDSLLLHTAERLQARIERNEHRQFSLASLMEALTARRTLFTHPFAISIRGTDGHDFGSFNVSAAAHPQWITAQITVSGLHYQLDAGQMTQYFRSLQDETIPRPLDSLITAVVPDGGVLRVTTDRPAEPGYVADIEDWTKRTMETWASTGTGLMLEATYTPGAIINGTDQDLGDLQFLASGRSNFAGSGGGRIANVRRGLADYMQDVLIPPGATFSFNTAVHNMRDGGWEQALMIQNGKDLVPIAGGGICQVATTVYRASVNAGLPVTERANHSLYVSYYEKYGVGIDATIFPHSQDLAFVNDTGEYILMQAYSRGFEAAVHLYGHADGRSVALKGPFFSTNGGPVADQLSRALKNNEIAWLQTVRSSDGTETKNVILSRYLEIPRRLRTEYAVSTTSEVKG